MTWNYRKFSRHPVSTEKVEMRIINTIISDYHYIVDPEVGKGFDVICRIPYVCPTCVAQLDKDCLPTIAPSSQPRYACF